MSGSGQPSLPDLDGSGLRVAIAASRWHDQVMGGLVAGARRALESSGVATPTLVRAAGCFELPLVVQALAADGYDAIVALGVVVRGGTPHFEYVCRAVTDGLGRVILDSGVPVGFGILTCDDEAQALDRAGLPASREDKGFEAAHAAVETALTLRRLRTHDG
jgi:6,7-dimethyl-8-ribityllumazine synthase